MIKNKLTINRFSDKREVCVECQKVYVPNEWCLRVRCKDCEYEEQKREDRLLNPEYYDEYDVV